MITCKGLEERETGCCTPLPPEPGEKRDREEGNEKRRKERRGGYGEVINKDLGTGIPCADGFN
jgi:hypothetical protein